MSENIPEFGIKRENEERRDGGCAIVFDPKTRRFAVGVRPDNGLCILFAGGVNKGEDIKDGVLREVAEESGLHNFSHVEKVAEAITHYYNSAKRVNRVAHATCFLAILKDGDLVPTKLEAHETFVLNWKTADEICENWISRNKNKDYDHWLYFMDMAVARVKGLGY